MGVLKFEMVTLPSFSKLTSYFEGSGFKLDRFDLRKLSLAFFLRMENLELLANLEMESK